MPSGYSRNRTPLVVAADKRTALTKMSRSGSLAQREVLAAQGVEMIEVARRLGVSRETVRRVWSQYGLRPWHAETAAILAKIRRGREALNNTNSVSDH